MNASVFNQVQQMAAAIFGVPPERVTPELTPQTIGCWDSMQHLNLILAIEERFNLQLEPEEIDQMKSIGHITTLLTRRFEQS
jgi:acyl carrier protein